ncbi:DNA damage-regulated autophagy modulator protein 2 [Cephus cinctus]|uniref:DNA damage-regulated autophagy modulator protein 2 n=1 Tax=Cephus cinctus TaxID=211228 RepID=A0AAJ7FMZ6_CEPCN|nr:DNA damage-regulated autophagy modulator protein 2 [Cephus cinctus]XP_015599825.1 DNA damage-regulated autophagy modulator protein 2 [Cephus cinctus]XP_024942876.1 DNA damage-regulated autophagy modulator protein 2 [Cephus cinctus]
MEKEPIFENVHYLPIVLFVALPTTFIVTYVIAVLLGHVEAGFPYISDAATYAPESCIFAQFINMTAALMCFVIYIRYSQIKECNSVYKLNESLPKWNRMALIMGMISTIGLSIVANFQETSVVVVHLIGAFMCFGGGTAYFWTQAMCSYYLHPLGCSIRIAHLRLALSIFCTVCFFIILITGMLAHMAYNGTNPRKWYKEDGGWELHVVSTVTEWICAVAFCVYILTFTDEFREIELKHPKVIYKSGRLTSSNEILNESQHSVIQIQTPPTIT